MSEPLHGTDLFSVLPLIVLLGTLANASGNSHTAVANQARLLIVEFHNLRFSDKPKTGPVTTHLKNLREQIIVFEGRTRRCAYIHIANYSALCIAALIIPSMKVQMSDPLLSLMAELLVILIPLLLSLMCVLRIQELLAGKETMTLAVAEVQEASKAWDLD